MTAPATGTTPSSGGEGGTAPSGTSVTSPVPAPAVPAPAVPAAPAASAESPKLGNNAIDSMVARQGGNYRKVIRALLVDNHEYRQQTAGMVKVPEGGVVLTKDQAAQWAEFTSLGKPVADLRTVLTEHATLTTAKAEEAYRTAVEGMARTAGYNPGLLFRVAKADGVKVESRKVTIRENGKQVQYDVLHVIDGDKAVPLDDYREQHWKDLLPEPTPPEETEETEETEEGAEDTDIPAISPTGTAFTGAARPYPSQGPARTTAQPRPSSKVTVESAVKSHLDRLYKPKPAAK